MIRQAFAEHGQVTSIKIIKDPYTGEARGFGFVEMPSKEEAQKAIQEMDGIEMEGRTLIINEARPRKERPGGHQRGGGGGGGHRGPRSRSW